MLTPELIRDILQVVASDRRNYSEHFDFVDKADRGNDEIFYAALLNRIEASKGWCRSLEQAYQRSGRERERQRAPSVKIWKWLRVSAPGFPSGFP